LYRSANEYKKECQLKIYDAKDRFVESGWQYVRANWPARTGAWLVMFLLLVFLAGCGLFRNGQRGETPTVTQAAPPITQVGPTQTQTKIPPVTSGPTVTPTQAVPNTSSPTPSKTPSPGTGGIAIGVYQPQPDASGRAIDEYVAQVGKKPAFAWQPTTWQRVDGSYVAFDRQVLEEYRTRGIMPGLTWEPSKGPAQRTGPNQPEFSWKQIASGRYDSYITQFAKDAAAYRYPFILRVLHEMDGTWYPLGYNVNGNTNLADFVAAYKHIVDLFRAAGATNVQFVWNPTVIASATLAQVGDKLRQAYPGDNYVDWVALDGYNSSVNDWQSLQNIFEPSYQFITSITSRPMILFEVGSINNPQDPAARADWIKQGFLTTIPNQFPNVKVVVYFNSKDGSGRDFSLDASPDALNAWKQVVSSSLYQGSFLK
jgi:mannan endo-1,4-beta-mannosidase